MKKVLIANRGEIAVRLIRACQAQGLATVAVYTAADAAALHPRLADEALHLGPDPRAYLLPEALLAAARQSGADALHPGYGFLAENPDFARQCQAAGLIWIGPQPEVIEQMGVKTTARQLAEAAGLPLIPGFDKAGASDAELLQAAEALGLPLLIKAAAGGGGRGMRRVQTQAELPEALQQARREARQAFGDDSLYLERWLPAVRHIEVQLIGDGQGKVLHAFERECSVQRRYQKLLEESPSPSLSAAQREAITAAAVKLGQHLNYLGLGTVEFVFDPASGGFYFLEVNTRLQVEHPVTEAVTGLDLVHWQLLLAQGAPLSLTQDQIQQQAHAIEVRLCAENIQLQPVTGTVLHFSTPAAEALRCDSGLRSGTVVGIDYDPLLAKLIARGPSRALALQRLQHQLANTRLFGLPSNLPMLQALLASEPVRAGAVHTRWLEDWLTDVTDVADMAQRDAFALTPARQHEAAAVALLWRVRQYQHTRRHWPGVPAGWRSSPAPERFDTLTLRLQGPQLAPQDLTLRYRHLGADRLLLQGPAFSDEVSAEWMLEDVTEAGDGLLQLRCSQQAAGMYPSVCTYALLYDAASDTLWLHHPAFGNLALQFLPRLQSAARSETVHDGSYQSQMPARIVALHVSVGQPVAGGDPLLTLESMKMESQICASAAGTVSEVFVSVGDTVSAGALLLRLQPETPAAAD